MSSKAPNSIPPIIGSSHALKAAMRDAKRLATSDLPVLITGETGTGKELIAEAIYQWWDAHGGATTTGATSPSASRPFLTFNCAAIPDELAESELFGHEEGAFTGARRKHNGLFKLADGGALFLDEVGDLSLVVQAKLLRALQLGEVRPLGGERVIRVRVRVIAATNKDLRAEVKAGRFREDLFYRLNANVPVCLPPLRERRSDIPALVDLALERLAKTKGPRKRVRRDGLAFLMGYGWPGNVRELLQAVETAAALCTGTAITRVALARALGITNIGESCAEDVATAAVREATERRGLSAGRLRDLTGCSKKEAHAVLRDLQRRRRIARRGTGRATYYVAADARRQPEETLPMTPVRENTPAVSPPAVVQPAAPPALNARQAELVATLPVGGRVTTGEYGRRFGVGRVTAFRDLDALAEAKVLVAVGRGRSASYVRRPT